MGINGLWKFFKDQIELVYIDKFYTHNKNDKVIIKPIFMVDINLYLHKYIIGIRHSGKDMVNNNGIVINHLQAITRFIRNFTDNMLIPFCVFDGKSIQIKEDTIMKRREIRENAKESCEKIKQILDIDNIQNIENDLYNEYVKNFKKSFSLTSKMIDECKLYLDLCGIPYITALNESDPQLVGLSHYYQNIIEGIYSEDSDMFLYGAETLYKDFDKDKKTLKRLTLKSILNSLQQKSDLITNKYNINKITITKKIFIDFAKILGTDYNNGIRKYGGNDRDKLFELFILYNCNLQELINNLKKSNKINNEYYIPDDFLEKSELINSYYENVKIIDPDIFNIKLKEPEVGKIKILLTKNNFREDIITNITHSLVKIYKIFNNCIKRIYSHENSNINFDINSDIKNDIKNNNEWIVVKNKKHKSASIMS